MLRLLILRDPRQTVRLWTLPLSREGGRCPLDLLKIECGWLSKLWSLFGSLVNGNHNFHSHPCGCLSVGPASIACREQLTLCRRLRLRDSGSALSAFAVDIRGLLPPFKWTAFQRGHVCHHTGLDTMPTASVYMDKKRVRISDGAATLHDAQRLSVLASAGWALHLMLTSCVACRPRGFAVDPHSLAHVAELRLQVFFC